MGDISLLSRNERAYVTVGEWDALGDPFQSIVREAWLMVWNLMLWGLRYGKKTSPGIPYGKKNPHGLTRSPRDSLEKARKPAESHVI